MTYADRLLRWNRWFDATPEDNRAQILLWPLVFVGFVNMQLTISGGFPFGLLVLLALIAVAFVRIPYIRGWIKPAATDKAHGARLEVGRVDWLHDLNTSYDSLSGAQRVWIVPAILIVVGAVNMKLTLSNGYPFGLLFLIALLAIIAIRAPFVAGIITPPPAARGVALVPHWLIGVNARYDALPASRRFWTFLAAVAVIGAISLDLTLVHGTPFGLLFLVAFLVIVAVRAPYLAGWLGTSTGSREEPMLALEQTHKLSHDANPLRMSSSAERVAVGDSAA